MSEFLALNDGTNARENVEVVDRGSKEGSKIEHGRTEEADLDSTICTDSQSRTTTAKVIAHAADETEGTFPTGNMPRSSRVRLWIA